MRMEKTISAIYAEYKIMPSLQEHMFRVAAVASVVCDNFHESLPKEEIITACLLHDMGNIIKSSLEYFPEFNEPEGIEYWQKVKNEFINKYGSDEHKATIQIIQEINLSSNMVNIINSIDFLLACDHFNENNMIYKIVNYADWRVDPYGIVSYEERLDEAGKRYKNHKDGPGEEERKKLVACGREIEKQIFAKCKIKPEDINNENVAPIISELKNFMIK